MIDDKKGLIIMKTCYGGYCYEHTEGGDYSVSVPSSVGIFLVALSIATILFMGTGVTNEASLGNYLANGDFNTNYLNLDLTNSEYINSETFMP